MLLLLLLLQSLGKVGASIKARHTGGWILEGGLGWIERVTGGVHMIGRTMHWLRFYDDGGSMSVYDVIFPVVGRIQQFTECTQTGGMIRTGQSNTDRIHRIHKIAHKTRERKR